MQPKKEYSCTWIIGGQGGIGANFTELLVQCSTCVCSCDSKPINNAAVSKNCYSWSADCSKYEELSKFSIEALNKCGPPELLVITAGYVSSLELSQTTPEEMDKIYAHNFKLAALAINTFTEVCNKDSSVGKSIVIVISNAAFVPRPSQAVYAAMKSALASLVASEASSLGKVGIRINAIAPGTVAVPRNIESLKKKFKSFPYDPLRPLRRIAFPDDLRGTLELFINKDSLITGQTLIVDGGSNLQR
jgi:3-oxoacyl-[acyl-carrier protein] reductase